MRDQSASVLLPPAQDQQVLITGGGNINTTNPGINLTDIVDLKSPSPAYQPGPDLPGLGKMYLNATILPDRTVLISNGGRLNRDDSTNVLSAAIYDPATNTMTVRRGRSDRAQLPQHRGAAPRRPRRGARLEPRRRLVRDAHLDLPAAIPVQDGAADDLERSGARARTARASRST